MGARKLAELIGGKGKVAMVLHMPGSYSTMERERGFEDVMKKEFPAIEIVARQYGMSDRSKSMAAAENMLTAHPDLQGMFCSTEPSSTGTSLALKERGLAGKVKFVAFDSAANMIEDLNAGVIRCHGRAGSLQDGIRGGEDAGRQAARESAGEEDRPERARGDEAGSGEAGRPRAAVSGSEQIFEPVIRPALLLSVCALAAAAGMRYKTASNSKQITAAAIPLLADGGKPSLDQSGGALSARSRERYTDIAIGSARSMRLW